MTRQATVTIEVQNRLGLHARPAMAFVDTASAHQCEVRVRREDAEQVVNGKSIMEVMMLAATQGVKLVIEAEGEDAEQACAALKKLAAEGFHDD
ncbi:MAG: HPr family phosphocarrier protein [Planctomycetota bacterium]